MLVGYMRVSTDSDRQSTNLQRDALLAAGVDARHLFEDRASGARDDRPGWTKALEFFQPGDVLVVWKLDRLGRSLSHLLAIVNALKEKRVAFRSLTENLDTTTPSGEFLFQVFGALAQYERALTSAHSRASASWPGSLPPNGVAVAAAVRRRSPARSSTPSSPRSMAACPKRPCAATSVSSAPP
ncbi:resolvase [Thauera sp. 27]|uniref:recombinase family protein n=1 Tax=Thauera sp. 27 TaxID=305700 RepID=UPI0002D08CD1|nr:resolvase [Thauera sp. 27]